MPDEPSTPEICDRPHEKHEQLSATPGNLTLSRPFKGLLLPFVDDLRSQIPPKWCIRQVGCDFSESGALHRVPVRTGEVAMTLRVRALSEEEAHRLARMTRSQKLGAGLVRRAQIIQHAVDGLSAPGIAAKMGLCDATVRFWLKRFNERGLPGLEEEMRSGRPPTCTAEERSAVIAAALSRPAELGLPFASWTLDRLVAYLGEKGIGMKRSRMSE